MFKRLGDIFSQQESQLARKILKACAKTEKKGLTLEDLELVHHTLFKDPLLRKEEDLDYVLDVLKHDGYLIQEGEQFLFFSNMLRDYWKTKR